MAKTYKLDQNLVNFLQSEEAYYAGRIGEGWMKIANECRIAKEWVQAHMLGETKGDMPGLVVTWTSEALPSWGTYGT